MTTTVQLNPCSSLPLPRLRGRAGRGRPTLALAIALALATAPAFSQTSEKQSLEEVRNTVINLLEALVQKGVMTRDQAAAMVASAQEKAAATPAPPLLRRLDWSRNVHGSDPSRSRF